MIVDVFEVVFHACTASINYDFIQERTPFIGKSTMLKKGSKNYYAVAIVKRTAGCTKVIGHGPIGSMYI